MENTIRVGKIAMSEKTEEGGIRVSSGALSIFLLIFVQTCGAIWWASAQNEKTNTILSNQTQQAKDYREQAGEIQTVKADLQGQIDLLKTYNQQLREKLASRGLLK